MGLEIATWIFIGAIILNMIFTILLVGKPREPITGGLAVFSIFIGCLELLVLLAWLGVFS